MQLQKVDKHSIHRRKIDKTVTDLPPLAEDYKLLKSCKEESMYKNVSQMYLKRSLFLVGISIDFKHRLTINN